MFLSYSSQFVKEEIESKLFRNKYFQSDMKSAIRQVICDLEKTLFLMDSRIGEFSGTTLTMAVVRGSKVVIANIGDSRIVLAKRPAAAHAPSRPHSLYGSATSSRSGSLSDGNTSSDSSSGASTPFLSPEGRGFPRSSSFSCLSDSSYSGSSSSSDEEEGDEEDQVRAMEDCDIEESGRPVHTLSATSNNSNSTVTSATGGAQSPTQTDAIAFETHCAHHRHKHPHHQSPSSSKRHHHHHQHHHSNNDNSAMAQLLQAESLTIDHKPDLLQEHARIMAAGGRVFAVRYADGQVGPPRVWLGAVNAPGLAMSRSLGDFIVHTVGVSALPDIYERDLDAECDCMLILATDGLWDVFSNEEAVAAAAQFAQPHEAVGALVRQARERWMRKEGSIDDISVCVVHLNAFHCSSNTTSASNGNRTLSDSGREGRAAAAAAAAVSAGDDDDAIVVMSNALDLDCVSTRAHQ